MMRVRSIIFVPEVSPVLGALVPRNQMAPSSRCGRNSEPIRSPVNNQRLQHTAATAAPTITQR